MCQEYADAQSLSCLDVMGLPGRSVISEGFIHLSHPHEEYQPVQPPGTGLWSPSVPEAMGVPSPPPAMGVPDPSWRPPLPPEARVPNLFAWLLTGTLAASLVMAVLMILWASGFFQAYAAHDTHRTYGFEIILFMVAGLVLRAATIVFALCDWRLLKTVGVIRPFHWAWIFLGPAVYMTGRTVVLWKVTRKRLLTPMITFGIGYLILVIASLAAAFVFLDTAAQYRGSDTVSVPSSQSSEAGTHVVANGTDGFTSLFRAEPQSHTESTTLDGLAITQDQWTIKDSGYPIQSISAARFSCTPSASKLGELTLEAEKSTMLRLTGQHGTGQITENKAINLGSVPARRMRVSFSDQSGTKLSAYLLIIDRGSSQIIATAIGPDGTSGPAAFIDSVRLLDSAAPTTPPCTT